jgi:hypothetical protein
MGSKFNDPAGTNRTRRLRVNIFRVLWGNANCDTVKTQLLSKTTKGQVENGDEACSRFRKPETW